VHPGADWNPRLCPVVARLLEQPAAGPAAEGNGRSRRSGTCRLLLALTGRRAAVARGAAGVPRRTRIVSGRAPGMAGRAPGVSSRAPRLAGRASGVPGGAPSVARRRAVLARWGAAVARRVAAVARRPWRLAGHLSDMTGRRCGVTSCASRSVRSLAAGRSAAGARSLGGRFVLLALPGVRALLLLRRVRLLAVRGRAWRDRVAVAQMGWKCISRDSDRHERVLLGVRVVTDRHLLGVLGRSSGRTRR
jgi:hypothetical protein